MPADSPVTESADEPTGSSQRKGKRKRKQLPLWQETLLLLVIALALAIVLKSFFIQAFYIPSPSMEPQFIKNDRILVEKWSYWFGKTPKRGDIVVFKDPGGWLSDDAEKQAQNAVVRGLEAVGLYPTGGHLVKRVIGVGGDRVMCCDARGRVRVNGIPLAEKPYLPKGIAPSEVRFDVAVPRGKLWMMGDNRSNSWDSRGHMGAAGGGFVPTKLVVGKVFSLVWPFKRAEFIERPKTFSELNSK